MATPADGASSSVAVRGRRPHPVPRLGHICFPCSDYSLTFATHQAIGGHRKFHTKLLDPNLRKLLRQQRRKISIDAANTTSLAAADINQKPQEEEEWHTVEVKISDHMASLEDSTQRVNSTKLWRHGASSLLLALCQLRLQPGALVRRLSR